MKCVQKRRHHKSTSSKNCLVRTDKLLHFKDDSVVEIIKEDFKGEVRHTLGHKAGTQTGKSSRQGECL